MISAKQIRAARALLGLSQKEASEGAGIGMTTLSGIEGTTAPTAETARKLQAFYEGCGLQFIEPDGVRLQPGDVEYRGRHGLQRFFDAVFDEARHGRQICIFNGVPGELTKWAGEDFYQMHAKRMTEISDRFVCRVIVKQGEAQLIGSSFATYKYIDAEKFHDRTFYIYGDKVGFLTFGDELVIRVMNDAEIAASMRILFNFAWDAV